MVQFFESENEYNHDFATASLAYLNRYPNPYAKHVLSSDTLLQEVDKDGNLRLTRVAVKTGRLPNFIKPFLGTLLDSWIVEKIIIDPKNLVMKTYNSNIDHQKFIRVEEYLHYTATSANTTKVGGKVKFSSNFIGFKKKIEDWSKKRFTANMGNTRMGLAHVMNNLQQRRWQSRLAA